jgi:hypothetical protein
MIPHGSDQLKWAILGESPAIERWTDWLATRRDQRIVAIWPGNGTGDVPKPDVRRLGSWSDLLEPSVADVIAVAATDFDDRALALRQLADYGACLLIEIPDMEPILGYELAMIQAERGARLIPYYPAALHPWIEQLRVWCAEPTSCPIGSIEQLSLERIGLPTDTTSQQEFARDAIVLRRLLGPIDRLQAMGNRVEPGEQIHASPRDGRNGLASASQVASVHLQSVAGIIAQWSLVPARHASPARLVVRGWAGSLVIEMPQPCSGWTARADWSDEADRAPVVWADLSGWDPQGAVLEQVQRARAGREVQLAWDDAYRAAELADLMELSGRRGRTLDIHNQEVTERDTFKGVMSAIGCFLLLATPLLLVAGMILQGILRPLASHPVWRLWPVLVLIPLGIFLVLQLLLMVFPPERRGQRPKQT